jgi:plastocyanin
MSRHVLLATALLCFWIQDTCASEVSGLITVQAKMARKTLAPAVYELRGMTVPDKKVVSNGDHSAGRVAVWLDAPHLSPAAPVQTAMQQRERRLVPDLLIVPVGSTIEFPNLDPIFHNIFSLSSARTFDLGYYPEGKSRRVAFPRAGIVQVYCHIHPEMYGVVVVTSSPWFARPASDGTFSWPDVPAGKYRLMVWQKSAGIVGKNVSVPESGAVHVRIALPEETPDD